MSKLMKLSLIVNILVLIPVSAGLVLDTTWATSSYGEFTPARGILLSIYASILIVSIIILFIRDPNFAVALLAVQVIYKLTTPFTVETLLNPVVISNLAIAVLHTITIYVTYKSGLLSYKHSK